MSCRSLFHGLRPSLSQIQTPSLTPTPILIQTQIPPKSVVTSAVVLAGAPVSAATGMDMSPVIGAMAGAVVPTVAAVAERIAPVSSAIMVPHPVASAAVMAENDLLAAMLSGAECTPFRLPSVALRRQLPPSREGAFWLAVTYAGFFPAAAGRKLSGAA